MTVHLTDTEADFFRDTLTILMAVHSRGADSRITGPALELLKANGATDADSAQVVILDRVLKMAGRLL